MSVVNEKRPDFKIDTSENGSDTSKSDDEIGQEMLLEEDGGPPLDPVAISKDPKLMKRLT